MGSPRRQRKKYKTPQHPWNAAAIEKERELIKAYGLKNKKEIWKAESRLSKIKRQVKKIITSTTKQAEKEKQQLISKLFRYNLIQKDTKMEDILELNINNILDRRLQTILLKKKIARTPKQARQLITHGNIMIDNRKITIPSYLTSRDEENKISLNPNIKLAKPEIEEKPKK